MSRRWLLHAAVVVLSLALSAPASAHGPRNGRIGFASDRGTAELPFRQLYSIAPDGSDLRPLLPDSFDTSFDVAYTPDGRYFAFTSILDPGYFELHIARADGTQIRRLTFNEFFHDAGPAWDPRGGGKFIFVSDRDAVEPTLNNFEIYSTSLAHPDRTLNLTRNLANDCACYDPFNVFAQPSYSPDGRQIAFTSDIAAPDTNADVYVMDRDGSHLRRLTTDPGVDAEPDWSPDGRRIAFQSARDGDLDVYVMDPRGRHVRPLTVNADSDSQPDWSPDGRKLAFASNRSRFDDIWVMDGDGRRPRNVTNDEPSDERPDWQAKPRW